MHVAKLEISGVRSFAGPRSVDLDFTRPDGSRAGWTVLAGRNGSGKSTLLQAITLALAGPLVSRSLAGIEDWAGSGDGPGMVSVKVVSHAMRPGEIAVTASVSVVFHDRGEENREPEWADSHDDVEDFLWSSRPVGWFYAAYGPFRRHSFPDVGFHDRGTPPRGAGVRTLFDEDATLVEGVSWLIGQHLLRFEGRPGAAELLDTVLVFLGDGLLPDGFRICRVDSAGLWISRSEGEFPLRRMSDGYRTVSALVVDIIRRMHATYGTLDIEERAGIPTLPYPGVVLIDEVDAHLHVSWQKKIGEWLKAHFPEIQFIVTTHSPYVCQSADPGGLIRLPGPDEEEPARVVDEDLYARVVYGSGDDAVLSELFGVDTPYSDRAESIRDRIGELEGKVLDGDASEAEVEEYQQLSKKIQSSLSARVHEVSSRLGFDG